MKRLFFRTILHLIDALDYLIDYLIDSYNLWHEGYEQGPDSGRWMHRPSKKIFQTRSAAVNHMKLQFESDAVRAAIAIQGTNFSGKSRNSSCICGSGRKFKKCCLNRGDAQ